MGLKIIIFSLLVSGKEMYMLLAIFFLLAAIAVLAKANAAAGSKAAAEAKAVAEAKAAAGSKAAPMAKSGFSLSTTELELDPDNVVYRTPELTLELAQAIGIAAGKSAAPSKPPLEPPAGGLERWIEQVSCWMEYVLSPENGLVREFIKRRTQYLANMQNPEKKHVDALKSFNKVNKELREKFLLLPRDPLKYCCDALKNNDDVADFLRAKNLMK